MGAPAQQPVYYDTDKSQYYTMSNPKGQSNNLAVNQGIGAGNLFGQLFANVGIPNAENPFYAAAMANRNYLGNPYGSANPNRFTTNAQLTPYAELTNLFPSLNTSSAQGLMSSTQPDGAMAGAGRFLAPQTTNTQGK